MSLLAQLDQKIAANGGLIVSRRLAPDSPLDKPEIVAAMALAAETRRARLPFALKVWQICKPRVRW